MEVAVVFIPRDSDETWRVSSEKIPHMTFLYLEVSTESELSEIIGYVEHVVKTQDTADSLRARSQSLFCHRPVLYAHHRNYLLQAELLGSVLISPAALE